MDSVPASRVSTAVLHGRDPFLPSLGIAPTFLFAFATLLLACEHYEIAGFWPANSVVLALLLQTRPQQRWLALGAGFIALASARFLVGCPLATSLVLSGVNTVEILACAGLVWLSARNGLDAARPGHWISFLMAAGVVAPLTSALIAGWFLSQARGLSFVPTVSAWYAGDAIGLVAMTPILVAASQVSLRLWRRYVAV